MIFNIVEEFTSTCEILIQLGNIIIHRSTLPIVFAKQQFFQAVMSIVKDNRPMQVMCLINDKITQEKVLKNGLIFKNNTFVKEFCKGEENG